MSLGKKQEQTTIETQLTPDCNMRNEFLITVDINKDLNHDIAPCAGQYNGVPQWHNYIQHTGPFNIGACLHLHAPQTQSLSRQVRKHKCQAPFIPGRTRHAQSYSDQSPQCGDSTMWSPHADPILKEFKKQPQLKGIGTETQCRTALWQCPIFKAHQCCTMLRWTSTWPGGSGSSITTLTQQRSSADPPC